MARISLRLTADNLSDLKKGDVVVGAEDLGAVRSARLTVDGYDNARVYGEQGDDILGLPSTIEVERR